MNIVYTINKTFYYQLYVSIKSMILNSNCKFNIYIVIDDLDNDKKIELEKIANLSTAKINIIFLKPLSLKKLSLKKDRGSISQYYRLFLDDIFQYNNININDVGKILYLDADTMLVDDIKSILDIDLNGYSVGACLDAWSPYYRRLFNLNKDTPMLNSGVLLIDLIKWQKQNISNKIINLINNRRGFFNQGDQGILNELFKGDFKVLSLQYNLNSLYIQFSYEDIVKYRKPINFYKNYAYICSKNTPVIIHFISSFLMDRPWQYNIDSYYGNLWNKYCSNKYFYKLSDRNNVLLYIYNNFNKGISLSILGVLQAYVRPLLLNIKKIIINKKE